MGAIRGLISSVAQAAGRFDEERCGGTRWLGHPAFVRSIQHVKQRHAFDRSRGAIASEVCDHDEAKKSPRAWSRKACPRTRSGGGVRFSDEDHAPRKREAKRRKTHAIHSAPFLPEGRGCGSGPSQTSLRSLRNSSACGDRSPSGAPLRRLPRRANARTQPRPRFTRNTMRRRYLRLESRLSKAPCAPVVMPAGHSSLGANCVHCL